MRITNAIKHFYRLQLSTIKEFIRDRGEGMAASLTYFQLLSLAPICGFILFFSFKIFGHETLKEVVIPLMHLWFPEQFVVLIKEFLKYAEHLDEASFNTLSWIAGIALALATKEYFAQLKDSIEIMWNDRRERFGFKPMLKKAIEDYAVTIISLLILFSILSLRILLPFPILEDLSGLSKFNRAMIAISRILFEFLLLFGLAQFIFWKSPSYKISFKDAIPGALMFSFLQIIGREIMKIHMKNMAYEENIELVLVMLAWIYYYNLVFIYCAQFSKCLIAHRRNIDIQKLRYD